MKSRSLKIVIFTTKYLSYSETFIYNHIQSLANDNDVLVICTEVSNESIFPYANIETIEFEKKEYGFFKRAFTERIYYQKKFSQNLTETIDAFGPDIIHCHYGINGLILNHNYNNAAVPTFVTFHGYDASKLLQSSHVYRSRLKQLLSKDYIYPIAVSHKVKENLESSGVGSDNMEVSYLGVDTAFFKRQTREDNAPVFIQVSRFVEKKGHVFTIRAFAEYLKQTPEVSSQLVFIGEGDLIANCKNLCDRLQLNDHVVFLGKRDKEGIRDHLDKATVYLQHSIVDSMGDMEGLPISIMEAMAMELPVLSTMHSGIPEIIEDGVNGYLVAEKDLDAYVSKMIAISKWPLLAVNRLKIMNSFNIESNNNELLSRYHKKLS